MSFIVILTAIGKIAIDLKGIAARLRRFLEAHHELGFASV